MKRKLIIKNKLKRSLILKLNVSKNSNEATFECSTDTHADVKKLKKIGQEIALSRRLRFSKLNKRQAKKLWKKHFELMNFVSLGDISRYKLKSEAVIVDI